MTLRERDTTAQRIGKIDDVIEVIKGLCSSGENKLTWDGACERLSEYCGTQEVDQ